MFAVSLDWFLAAYLVVGLGIIGVAAFYYDHRHRRQVTGERAKSVFHCLHCDRIYAARFGLEEATCPACGERNGRLRF